MNLSKSLFLSLGVFIIGSSLQAQEWQYSNNNAYYNGGHVGIGTSSPSTLWSKVLQVYDPNNASLSVKTPVADWHILTAANGGLDFRDITGGGNAGRLFIASNGNVGIGTTSIPSSKFHIVDGNNYVRMGDVNGSSTAVIELKDVAPVQIEGYDSDLRFITSAIERVRITNGGNVLIGKSSQTNTSYKLDINGNVRSNKIVVNTTGADFVFEEDYSLRTLEELQKYIRQNKHLPEIPSAKEMEKEGLDVGEMNIKLLQKLEEMTLYIIAQNKKMQELEERIKIIETK